MQYFLRSAKNTTIYFAEIYTVQKIPQIYPTNIAPYSKYYCPLHIVHFTYRNFFHLFLRSAKYIANICGIFYGVQIIAPKFTLFFPKIFAKLNELLNKMQIFAQSFVHHSQFCKKLPQFFCWNIHCAKNTADLPHKYCSLLKILLPSAHCAFYWGVGGVEGGHLW